MTAPIAITSTITIEMPYPGAVISKNHMWTSGDRRKGLVKEAAEWKQTLADWLQQYPFYHLHLYIVLPVQVEIGARFVDERHRPDMHNLAELICDAIQDGIDVDDKHFEVTTRQPEMGKQAAAVIVTVKLRMGV
jgi:Holliday junction resolvase RusA-like endonuclease